MAALDIPACHWYERVWNQNDLAAITELTTRDLKAHGADGVTRSRAEFAEFQQRIRALLPDVRLDVVHCVQGRDMVAVHWVARGTHRGQVAGFPPPSGRRLEVSGLTLVRMEGDKIAEGWDTYDVAGMLGQLGALT